MTVSTNGLPTRAADLTLQPSASGQYSVDVKVTPQQIGPAGSTCLSWTLSPQQVVELFDYLDKLPKAATS